MPFGNSATRRRVRPAGVLNPNQVNHSTRFRSPRARQIHSRSARRRPRTAPAAEHLRSKRARPRFTDSAQNRLIANCNNPRGFVPKRDRVFVCSNAAVRLNASTTRLLNDFINGSTVCELLTRETLRRRSFHRRGTSYLVLTTVASVSARRAHESHGNERVFTGEPRSSSRTAGRSAQTLSGATTEQTQSESSRPDRRACGQLARSASVSCRRCAAKTRSALSRGCSKFSGGAFALALDREAEARVADFTSGLSFRLARPLVLPAKPRVSNQAPAQTARPTRRSFRLSSRNP